MVAGHEGRIDAEDHRHRRHGFKAARRKGDQNGNKVHSGDPVGNDRKERGERNTEHRDQNTRAKRPAQLRPGDAGKPGTDQTAQGDEGVAASQSFMTPLTSPVACPITDTSIPPIR
jgi:hypothetical protein